MRFDRAVTVLATRCVAFAGSIALYRYYGYEGIPARDGVGRIVALYIGE